MAPHPFRDWPLAEAGPRRLTGQDFEFLSSHKIKYIVNCAATRIPCVFLTRGLNYFRINWQVSDVKKIAKIAKNSFFSQIKMFFEMARDNFSPVLVHCSNGQGRSFIVVVLYLMSRSRLTPDRYKWSFYKTLEFMDSRKPNMEIKTSFFKSLSDIGKRLENKNVVSSAWDFGLRSYPQIRAEERVVTATFLNSRNCFSESGSV